jgi:hypothetical protein
MCLSAWTAHQDYGRYITEETLSPVEQVHDVIHIEGDTLGHGQHDKVDVLGGRSIL